MAGGGSSSKGGADEFASLQTIPDASDAQLSARGSDKAPKKWGELTKGKPDSKKSSRRGSKTHDTIRADLPGDVKVTEM